MSNFLDVPLFIGEFPLSCEVHLPTAFSTPSFRFRGPRPLWTRHVDDALDRALQNYFRSLLRHQTFDIRALQQPMLEFSGSVQKTEDVQDSSNSIVPDCTDDRDKASCSPF